MHKKMQQRILEKRGLQVFDSKDKFHRWLNAPCRALGDKNPAKLIETPEGFQQVLDILGRIEHNLYS